MKTVQVLQNGQGQVIYLPDEFHFEGNQVYIKKIGNVVVLIPEQNPWQVLFESLNQFTDDYMEDREQLLHEEREDIFV
jgi:antitoxin VapB